VPVHKPRRAHARARRLLTPPAARWLRSVVLGGALATQDARVKACRFVLNARTRTCYATPPALELRHLFSGAAIGAPAPSSPSENRSVSPAFELQSAHPGAGRSTPDSSVRSLATHGDEARLSAASANEAAAENQVGLQMELARRLCLHIRRLIPLRLANPNSTAIRLGKKGEHLVPVSAVTASFVVS